MPARLPPPASSCARSQRLRSPRLAHLHRTRERKLRRKPKDHSSGPGAGLMEAKYLPESSRSVEPPTMACAHHHRIELCAQQQGGSKGLCTQTRAIDAYTADLGPGGQLQLEADRHRCSSSRERPCSSGTGEPLTRLQPFCQVARWPNPVRCRQALVLSFLRAELLYVWPFAAS